MMYGGPNRAKHCTVGWWGGTGRGAAQFVCKNAWY